jgi:hypothetical protein
MLSFLQSISYKKFSKTIDLIEGESKGSEVLGRSLIFYPLKFNNAFYNLYF